MRADSKITRKGGSIVPIWEKLVGNDELTKLALTLGETSGNRKLIQDVEMCDLVEVIRSAAQYTRTQFGIGR